MRTKYILLLTTLALLSTVLAAQGYNSRKAIGFHAGTSSGVGYAMRWMGDKHGFQATFGGYTLGRNDNNMPGMYDDYDSYESGDDMITVEREGRTSSVNLGLNYMYILDNFRDGRLYVMGGGSYKYYQRKVFTQDYQWTDDPWWYEPVEGSADETYDVEHRWTVGAGPGVEFALGKQFRLAVELPLTYNWENDIVMWIPQAGIYYYFR